VPLISSRVPGVAVPMPTLELPKRLRIAFPIVPVGGDASAKLRMAIVATIPAMAPGIIFFISI
jgi:hypothetical protein